MLDINSFTDFLRIYIYITNMHVGMSKLLEYLRLMIVGTT